MASEGGREGGGVNDVVVHNLIFTGQLICRNIAAVSRAELPCCDKVVSIPTRLDKRFKHRLCEHGCYLWRGVLHRPPWPDEAVP